MIVYILKLKENKYYVGRTCHYERRMKDHFSGKCSYKGSYWTKRYQPLEVIRKIDDATSFDEDKVLKETMMTYGIDNVRGGSYVKHKLSSDEISLLEKEIRFAQDLCVVCGSDKHFVTYCDTTLVYKCEICDFEFDSENECEFHVKNCVETKEISCQTERHSPQCCCIIV